jgi:hypothetical protein
MTHFSLVYAAITGKLIFEIWQLYTAFVWISQLISDLHYHLWICGFHPSTVMDIKRLGALREEEITWIVNHSNWYKFYTQNLVHPYHHQKTMQKTFQNQQMTSVHQDFLKAIIILQLHLLRDHLTEYLEHFTTLDLMQITTDQTIPIMLPFLREQLLQQNPTLRSSLGQEHHVCGIICSNCIF